MKEKHRLAYKTSGGAAKARECSHSIVDSEVCLHSSHLGGPSGCFTKSMPFAEDVVS